MHGMKQKVAILAFYHGPRLGIGVYIDQLVSQLGRQLPEDFKLMLYTNRNTIRNSQAEFSGVRVVQSKMLNLGSIAAVFWSAIVFPVICFLRRHKVSVILTNPVVVMPMRKTISVVHDLNEFEMVSKYGRLRTFYRKRIMLPSALSKSAAIVAISKFVKRQIVQHFPRVPEHKIHIINNGVEVATVNDSEMKAALDEYKLTPQNYYLVVGRIDPKGKNLYETVELYRKLESLHSGHRLILAGGINDFCRAEAERFLQWIDAQDDLRGKVNYVGYVDERRLACLYRGARAAIFFSRYEGFGLPMIEAFKVGCPVIYNRNCQVLREHAEDAGFVVDESDSEDDLSCKVADLYDDAMRSALVSRMSSVTEKYDWAECAGQFWKLIQAVAR